MPAAQWRVTTDATDEEASALLLRDPVWNSFALADLEPPLREYSQFAIASPLAGIDEQAICFVLRHPIIGEVLSPFGSEDGVAAILERLDLPEHPLIQAQEIHIPLLQPYYRPETNWKGMLRMAVTPASARFPDAASQQHTRQLTDAGLPALANLYALNPESAFSAELFAEGLYVGWHDGDRLVAAGGTHALAPRYGIAVLGNIFTAPDARGNGYATAVTAALVTTLFEQQYSPVVLNVFDDNSPAIRMYQRLGFHTQRRLMTGRARRVVTGRVDCPLP